MDASRLSVRDTLGSHLCVYHKQLSKDASPRKMDVLSDIGEYSKRPCFSLPLAATKLSVYGRRSKHCEQANRITHTFGRAAVRMRSSYLWYTTSFLNHRLPAGYSWHVAAVSGWLDWGQLVNQPVRGSIVSKIMVV